MSFMVRSEDGVAQIVVRESTVRIGRTGFRGKYTLQ